MRTVAKQPLSRNLWYLMKEFKVLPTDERFQNLTDNQIGWMMENISIDAKQERLVRKGYDPANTYEDADDSWYDAPLEEFEPLRPDHDEADIARQVEAMTDKEALAIIEKEIQSQDQWNKYLQEGGEKAIRLHKEKRLKDNLERAYKKAAELEKMSEAEREKFKEKEKAQKQEQEFVPVDEEALDEALSLFNDGNDSNVDEDEWI